MHQILLTNYVSIISFVYTMQFPLQDDMINFFFLFLTANTKHRKFFAPCKGNQDSPGVWIPSRGFRISGTGFQTFVSGTWIPDSLSCIPDSSSKNFLDSGMQTPLHGVRFGSNRSFRRLCVYTDPDKRYTNFCE